jgi:signal transduction histidine kinase
MTENESVTGRDLEYIVENEIVHPEKYALHESEIIKKDGGRFWVAWRNKPLYDESGKISGIVRFGLDISDRRKAEEALFQTNKKLNLLSSITRHDILNQLTALSGYIELSKEATHDKKMLDFFDREKRATNTIQRLITFTKDYQDIGQYRPMWQNVQTIVHLLAKTIELNSTNLIINLSHLEIFADPLLEKVIYTLLENAMRHGGSPKSIRFSYQLVDKGCLILCEDDGTGVADAEKEKIFERGFGKHTGFGLFLSREILGITGFSIKETGTPGKGARFEIFVPHGSFRLEQKISETGN